MTRHTTALAQQLAWDLQHALCRDHTRWWSTLEAGYNQDDNDEEADLHLLACQNLCSACPVLEPCAERARLDRYTGLAAGTAFRNGRERARRAAS